MMNPIDVYIVRGQYHTYCIWGSYFNMFRHLIMYNLDIIITISKIVISSNLVHRTKKGLVYILHLQNCKSRNFEFDRCTIQNLEDFISEVFSSTAGCFPVVCSARFRGHHCQCASISVASRKTSQRKDPSPFVRVDFPGLIFKFGWYKLPSCVSNSNLLQVFVHG